MKKLPNLSRFLGVIILSLSLSLTMAHKAVAQPGTLYIHDNRTHCESPLLVSAEAQPLNGPACSGTPTYALYTSSSAGNVYTYDYTDIPVANPVQWIAVTFWAADPASSDCNFGMGGNMGQVGPCPQTQYPIMNVECLDYCNGNTDFPVQLIVTYPCQGCVDIVIKD